MNSQILCVLIVCIAGINFAGGAPKGNVTGKSSPKQLVVREVRLVPLTWVQKNESKSVTVEEVVQNKTAEVGGSPSATATKQNQTSANLLSVRRGPGDEEKALPSVTQNEEDTNKAREEVKDTEKPEEKNVASEEAVKESKSEEEAITVKKTIRTASPNVGNTNKTSGEAKDSKKPEEKNVASEEAVKESKSEEEAITVKKTIPTVSPNVRNTNKTSGEVKDSKKPEEKNVASEEAVKESKSEEEAITVKKTIPTVSPNVGNTNKTSCEVKDSKKTKNESVAGNKAETGSQEPESAEEVQQRRTSEAIPGQEPKIEEQDRPASIAKPDTSPVMESSSVLSSGQNATHKPNLTRATGDGRLLEAVAEDSLEPTTENEEDASESHQPSRRLGRSDNCCCNEVGNKGNIRIRINSIEGTYRDLVRSFNGLGCLNARGKGNIEIDIGAFTVTPRCHDDCSE